MFMPQMMASIPKAELRQAVGTAIVHRDTIIRAIDAVISGL